jgi:hypothetical protein
MTAPAFPAFVVAPTMATERGLKNASNFLSESSMMIPRIDGKGYIAVFYVLLLEKCSLSKRITNFQH